MGFVSEVIIPIHLLFRILNDYSLDISHSPLSLHCSLALFTFSMEPHPHCFAASFVSGPILAVMNERDERTDSSLIGIIGKRQC